MASTKDGMDDTEQNEDEGSYSLARSRSRREVKKSQKSSAFERLRKAKEEGVKNRYELEEEKNVYDVVDEGEYSEMVRQRQDDDWIVDDDGAGYVEDGREIFDDEMDEDAPVASKKKKQDKTKNKNIVRPGTKPKQDIKSMFAAASVTSKKKSEKEATLADDDILQGLMGNIGKGTSSSLGSGSGKKASDPAKQVKRTQYNPFKTEGKSTKSTPPTPVVKKELSYSPLPKPSPMPAKSVLVKQEPSPKPKAFQKPMPTEPAKPETCLSAKSTAEVKADILPVLEDDTDLSGFDFSEEMDIPEDEGSEKVVEEPSECKKKLPSEELLTRGWENISSEDASESSPSASVQVDSSQLPLVTNSAGEKVLRFYWLDAYEDSYTQPGVVFLFGKVYIEKAKTYASCCVTVKNIERQLFLLPRIKKVNVKTGVESDEEVTMPHVYEEFDRLAEKHRILKFKSMKVKRSYAFEKAEVPAEADYLAIRYAADMPTLPSDLKGETFSHVFGTNTSSLELLLVGRKMKGPAWLDLRCPQMSKVSTSWCKFEAEVTRPDHVAISDCTLSPPPLVLMTLNLRTLPNAKTKQNEIVAVSCLINSKFYMDKPAPRNQPFERHFCVVTPPNDCVFPFDFRDQVKSQSGRMKIEVMPTERGLVAFLLAKIHREDPDLIVGHDIYGFDLDILLHRISANKIPHWSKISRLKRSVMPKLTHSHGRATFAEKSAVCGRIMCDVQISAKELIRCRSYDLTELTSQVLKEKRTELDYDEFRESFLKSQELLKALELTLFDSSFILRIMYELNTIPLALQITNICGNIMSRTLMGGRSERNEWLLLHAFQEKQYICPDKEFKKKQQPVIANEDGDDNEGGATAKTGQGKRKPAYAGGLVLEPKKGFYDTFILLLDFNSLYPSIIQEYNICFTTISRSSSPEEMDNEDESNLILPDLDLEPGVLPTEIRKLVESRKQVKALMKASDVTADQMMQYDIRQKALKLTANSMYGCLGFSFSRFYAKPLAALVTGKGREILMKTKDLVQNMGLDVIYGDTDSIMINSNSRDMDQVYKLGNRVKSEVNKLYRLLEIDIDGVFKSMLLLKKKKYAALSISKGPDGQVTTTEELKGLDIVRRDWSDLATQAGNYVVSQILSGESRELIVDNIHARLESVAEEVREGKLPVTLFHITKTLTKNPEDYPDKKSLPHVQVALRFNSKGGRKMRGGDTVPYVICEDGSTLSATQRAYHPDELNKQENLHIDYKYYLAHQIHPVVARLCDPIEGTDSARIAECLGLDPSGYRHAARQEEDQGEDLVTLQLTMEERFQDCDRLSIPCPSQSCGRVILLDSVFNCSGSNVTPVLQACPNPECRQSLLSLKNKLKNLIQLRIQKHVNKYYQGWLKCEDAGCNASTNKMPLIMQRGHPLCASCDRGYLRVEYSDSALYTQLCFYEYVFDVPKAMTFLNDQEKVQARKIRTDVLDVYRELKNHVTRWLDRSAYSNVDLGKLFGGLGLTPRPSVSDVTIKEEKGI